MPMMILSMVVLPAPLGPTSAKRSPGLIWKDAPLKRTRAPKLFSILSTRRIMVPPLTLCAYMKKGPNLRWSLIQCSGGDEGDRTPDLLTASQALSQLSYAPVRKSTIRELGRRCKDIFGKTFGGRGAGPARRPTWRAENDPPRATGFTVRRQSHYRIRLRAAPALRSKTMPVYYDESGMSDHARIFAYQAGSLPAVLQTENTPCSRVADPS